jgi:hypothetical protein
MSWLGALNFFVLQWFTVRLARVVQASAVSVGANVRLEVDESQWRDVHRPRRIVAWQPTSMALVAPRTTWMMLHGIVPLTGWWSPFRRLW